MAEVERMGLRLQESVRCHQCSPGGFDLGAWQGGWDHMRAGVKVMALQEYVEGQLRMAGRHGMHKPQGGKRAVAG